ARRHTDRGGGQARDALHVREPRRAGVRGSPPLRHPPGPQPAPVVRHRHPPLPRFAPRAARGASVPRRGPRRVGLHRAGRSPGAPALVPQQLAQVPAARGAARDDTSGGDMTTIETTAPFPRPEVAHLAADELPWATVDDGAELKVLQVDLARGLWIIRNRFQPGVQIPTHRHTGDVYGITHSGAWKYLEYDFVNRAGSWLFEPAGSVHTLTVPADNTEPTEATF